MSLNKLSLFTGYRDPLVDLYLGDAREVLRELPTESVDMVMTSPPYLGLRNYKAEPLIWDGLEVCQHEWRGQLGSEPQPDLYVKHLCDIFDLVKVVLKKTGTIYVNLDDSHSGSGQGGGGGSFQDNKAEIGIQRREATQGVPAKSLIGIPARFQLEMIRRGWICRNVLIWHKNNVMPESVKDRFTIDFEYMFFFSKSKRYYFERQFEPLKDSTLTELFGNEQHHGQDIGSNLQGRNRRSVWTINPQGYRGPHFATYPEELCRIPIESSCPEQICTKCGRPRVKVYSTGFTAHTGKINSKSDPGDKLNGGAGRLALLRQASRENGGEYVNDTEVIGLSDCGCGTPCQVGVVLDCFSGTATTGVMAKKLGRKYIGIEVSEKYHQLAIKRIRETPARMI